MPQLWDAEPALAVLPVPLCKAAINLHAGLALNLAKLARAVYSRLKGGSMNIGTGLKLRMAGAGLATLTLVGLAPGAQAVEAEYSGTFCMTSKVTVLESNPDVTTLIFEGWGIQTPNSTFKPWENATTRCVGYQRITDGKVTAKGSCRWVDSDGDTFTGEYDDAPGMPGKWIFLAGTGKWKGVKGSGTYNTVSRGKPAAPGTSQLCREHSGKYSLP